MGGAWTSLGQTDSNWRQMTPPQIEKGVKVKIVGVSESGEGVADHEMPQNK